MCKTKMDTNAIPPSPLPSPSSSRRHRTTTTSTITTTTTTTASTSSLSSRNSLSSLRSSLPENPHLYNISEIRSSTNNFLSKNFSTSSSSSRSWRCNLHGKDVIIFQRKSHLHQRSQAIRQKLSSISKSHHSAIVNLLGASISGEYIYLVYDFINGASLYDLLHNRNNPNFTVLNTWISRMQIATDLAHGLDYIHNNTGLDVTFVHNHIKSSSVIVTEPSLNAKICHFGAAELCNEPVEDRDPDQFSTNRNKIEEEVIEIIKENEMKTSKSPKLLDRSNSIKFNGTRGYMSPEFQSTGIGTRKSDVYAFGVVLLELISGEEPVKYKYDKEKKEYKKIAAVETAVGVVESGGEEREGRLRKWVDRRLKDSFPVDVAEKMTRLAVDCVHVDPNQRPDMRRVAGTLHCCCSSSLFCPGVLTSNPYCLLPSLASCVAYASCAVTTAKCPCRGYGHSHPH